MCLISLRPFPRVKKYQIVFSGGSMGDASSNINDAHFIFGHLHCSKVNVLNGNSRLFRGKQAQIVSLKFVKWSH